MNIALKQYPQVPADFLSLLVCWLLLLAFGLVMVSSASVALNGDYASKHLVFLVLSVLAFSVTFILPMSVWNKLYLVGWLGALAFALVVLLPLSLIHI